jgi:hypothetical protein
MNNPLYFIGDLGPLFIYCIIEQKWGAERSGLKTLKNNSPWIRG